MRRVMLAAAVMMAGVAAAPASAEPQPIEVKAGKAYKHKPSKVEFPASMAGLQRRQMIAYSPDLLDVSAEYVDGDEQNWISVYVYRNVSGEASVWFDRARHAILSLPDKYPGAKSLGIRPFTPRGQATASGLMDVFATEGRLKSTGLMVLPFNGFYAKVRVSSRTKTPAEVEAIMLAVANGFDWRSETVEEAAEAVRDCPSTLELSVKAKAVEASKEDRMMTALLGGVLAGAAVDKNGKEVKRTPGNFCREPGSANVNNGIYRFNASTDSYMVALGDNGTSLSVGTDALGALINAERKQGKPKAYNVTLTKMDRTLTFPQIDSLPTLDALFDHLNKNQPLSSATTWGKGSNVTITAQ